MSRGMLDGTRLLAKNIKQKKRVYFLEFGMIFMIAIMVFGMFIYYEIMENFTITNARKNGTQHVTLFGNVSPITENEKKQWGIKVYNRFVTKECVFSKDDYIVTASISWYESPKDIPLLLNINGRLPQNENELLVSEEIIKDGLDRNDLLECIMDNGENKSFQIVGTFKEDDNLFVGMNELIFSCGTINTLYDGAQIEFKKLEDIEKKSAIIAKSVDAERTLINNELLAAYGYGEDRISKFLLIIFVVLAIVILYGMINGTIRMRTGEINKEYAIWRSLGIRKRKLFLFTISESIWMGSIGGLGGSIFGYFVMLGALILSGVQKNEALEIMNSNFIKSFAVTLILTLFLTSVAKLSMLRTACSKNICDLFLEHKPITRNEKRERSRRNPVWAYISTSFSRNKGRLILSILLFSGGIFFFVLSATFRKTLTESYGDVAKIDPYYNVQVRLQEGYSEKIETDALVKKVSEIPGVMDVTANPLPYYFFDNIDTSFGPIGKKSAYYSVNGVYDRILVTVYTKEELNDIKAVLTEGNVEIENGGCLLVNYAYALDESGAVSGKEKIAISTKRIGDTISTVDISELTKRISACEKPNNTDKRNIFEELCQQGKTQDIEIKGIVKSDLHFNDSNNPVIIISEEFAKKMLDGVGAESSSLYVRLAKSSKLKDFQRECGKYSGLLAAEYFNFAYELEEEIGALLGIMNGLILIAVMSGFINIICTVLINWEVSRKEFAILKAVGATKQRVLFMIAVEKTLICTCSGIVGVVGGLGAGKLLMKALVKSASVLAIPKGEITISMIVMVLITCVLTLIQGKLLQGMNISNVLKSE